MNTGNTSIGNLASTEQKHSSSSCTGHEHEMLHHNKSRKLALFKLVICALFTLIAKNIQVSRKCIALPKCIRNRLTFLRLLLAVASQKNGHFSTGQCICNYVWYTLYAECILHNTMEYSSLISLFREMLFKNNFLAERIDPSQSTRIYFANSESSSGECPKLLFQVSIRDLKSEVSRHASPRNWCRLVQGIQTVECI